MTDLFFTPEEMLAMEADRKRAERAAHYMNGNRSEGTVWYFMADDPLFAGRPVVSPIAAEAHKGPVIDGTARRLE